MDRLLGDLRSIVGEPHVLVDDELRSGYETDWTGRWSGTAMAVVRPGSTAEVAAVLRRLVAEPVAVVPQGGNTGLVGGGVPRAGGASGRQMVVLSTRRLDTVGPVEPRAAQVTVGAGVTIGRWRAAAVAAGLDAPVDFAARDSATVGGAIATNAGGSRVLRFGTMRRQVVGIEAVLADGARVGSLAGLPKETAGIHWPSLLCGSEGTLGVVTAARLRLVPRFARTITAMVSTATVDDAVELLATLRSNVSSLDAVELILPAALELVAAHLDLDPPVEPPPAGTVLLVECADLEDPTDELLVTLSSSQRILDSAVSAEPTGRDRLLAFRDRITEAIAAAATARGTTPYKLDVAVPVDRLPALLATATEAAARDGCLLVPFGHLAEGNLHLNHIGARDTDTLASTVLRRAAELGGTVSAEHGIGVAKAPWLPLVRSAEDLAAQRRIKAALDPTGILNPGVLDR